jgi:hypothetical protein
VVKGSLDHTISNLINVRIRMIDHTHVGNVANGLLDNTIERDMKIYTLERRSFNVKVHYQHLVSGGV